MANNKHPVLIGYTNKLLADGLESIIDGSEDFSICGSIPINSLTEYLNVNNPFEILLIELKYPNNGDLLFITQLKKDYPLIRIMLVTQLASIELSGKLIDSGIDAYILKSCSKSDLLSALVKIAEGKNFFCSELIKSKLPSNNNHKNHPEIILTQRETEILSCLVNGKQNGQIAKELNLSESTIKTHRKNIFTKFGANNLIGMIRYACRSRLLDYGPDGFCIGCPHYK